MGAIYTELSLETYSQDWQDLITWDGDGGVFTNDDDIFATENILYLLFFSSLIVLVSASAVGLYFFKKWARTLTVVLSIVGLFVTYFMGISITTPVETISYDISAFLSGIIIAMAYLSPLNERF